MPPTTILTPFQTNVTVGTTAIMAAVPANPTRKGLIISNNSATADQLNVTFGAGTTNTPSATSGIPIAAGATFSLLPAMGPDINMGAQINMIAAAAATPVTVMEF